MWIDVADSGMFWARLPVVGEVPGSRRTNQTVVTVVPSLGAPRVGFLYSPPSEHIKYNATNDPQGWPTLRLTHVILLRYSHTPSPPPQCCLTKGQVQPNKPRSHFKGAGANNQIRIGGGGGANGSGGTNQGSRNEQIL